jgi:Uma2 family endonuclease
MVFVGNIQIPTRAVMAGFRRFSVKEYHQLINMGILTEDDNLELLEGYLVQKMTRNPPHDAAIQKGSKRLYRYLPTGWDIRVQCAVTFSESEPEPDFAIVRGDETSYLSRHPVATDIGSLIEVSDSTLDSDREDKGRIYARASVSCYWIVNLIDRIIEVYTAPSGPVQSPAYGNRQDYRPGDLVPLVLDGAIVAQVPVADLLP